MIYFTVANIDLSYHIIKNDTAAISSPGQERSLTLPVCTDVGDRHFLTRNR